MNVKQERRNSPVPLSHFHFVPLRTHAVTPTDRRGRQLRFRKQTTARNGTEGLLIAERGRRQRNTPVFVSSCTLRQVELAYYCCNQRHNLQNRREVSAPHCSSGEAT